jgi:FkbM family methyltransferase
VTIRSVLVRQVPDKARLRRRARRAWNQGERELRLLPSLCDKQELAIDVGASYGIYSFHLVRYAAGVVAIEPLPECVSFIRSALPMVRVIEGAASDHAGTETLWIPTAARATDSPTLAPAHGFDDDSVRGVVVNLVTLDSLELTRVGFMKIDVEGHELAVLRGAEEILQRDHPAILVEAEERHRRGAVRCVREHLERQGYSGFFLHRGRPVPVAQFEPLVHQDASRLTRDITLDPRTEYINNFIFVHSADTAAVQRLGVR